MGRGVIGADRGPPGVIDRQQQRGARLEGTLLNRAEMHKEIAGLFLSVGDTKPRALAGHQTGVADLASRLGIKWRLVENDRAGLAGLQAANLVAVFYQRGDYAFGGLGLVAEKLRRAELLA